MKTLQNFKDEVVLPKYVSWDDYTTTLLTGLNNSQAILGVTILIELKQDEAAERYAIYMCEQQRIICAEYAEAVQGGCCGGSVDKDSIRSAPLATSSTKNN